MENNQLNEKCEFCDRFVCEIPPKKKELKHVGVPGGSYGVYKILTPKKTKEDATQTRLSLMELEPVVKICKVWDFKRTFLRLLGAKNLDMLIDQARACMGVGQREPSLIVFDKNGMVVTEQSFQKVGSECDFMFLKSEEIWSPKGYTAMKGNKLPTTVRNTLKYFNIKHDDCLFWKLSTNNKIVSVVLRSGDSILRRLEPKVNTAAKSAKAAKIPADSKKSEKKLQSILKNLSPSKITAIPPPFEDFPTEIPPPPEFRNSPSPSSSHSDCPAAIARAAQQALKSGVNYKACTTHGNHYYPVELGEYINVDLPLYTYRGIHRHTAACGPAIDIQYTSTSSCSDEESSCDFHCRSLHEKGRPITTCTRSVATSPIHHYPIYQPLENRRNFFSNFAAVRRATVSSSTDDADRKTVRFNEKVQARTFSLESSTTTSSDSSEELISRRILLLEDYHNCRLSINDMCRILGRLTSILESVNFVAVTHKEDRSSWTIDAYVYGDCYYKIAIIYYGEYYELIEDPYYIIYQDVEATL